MPVHRVRPGECLTTICARRGFHDWKSVYNHPKNKDLRAKRPDPNLLHPGDEVFIPELQPKEFSISTGQVHNFVAKLAKKRIKFTARDGTGKPLANEPYVIELDSGDVLEGETDGDGLIDKAVSWSVRSAYLYILDIERELALASLNPMQDVDDQGLSGAQARLTNLGLSPGPVDGLDRPELHDAICSFQIREHLKLTGELDDATLKKLIDVHGC